MHVPDGFLDAPTSIATGVVAVAAVGLAVKKSRDELDERTAPLAGLLAAFIFAVQMLNFPVGVGTSGHLMGGALAAVLVGPWTAILIMSVVLTVQALLFADGGLSALGTNITLMGVVTVTVGWFVVKALMTVLPKRTTSLVPASFVGGLLSVPAAAIVFVVLFAIGGAVDLPFGPLLATMVGWHSLIGIGEGLITAATVGAVIAVRPDLVYAARGLMPDLQLDGVPASAPAAASATAASGPKSAVEAPRRRSGALVAIALAVICLLAGVASFYASGNPDGLEFVAEQKGFLEAASDHVFGTLALADYGDVGGIPVGVAGLIGVGVMLLVAGGIFLLLGRSSSGQNDGRTDGRPITAAA
jgi:cobalt/nickel transport system permease protein